MSKNHSFGPENDSPRPEARPKLRTVRVSSSRRVDKWVTYPRGDARAGGPVADLSADGLAFEIEELYGLSVGHTLDHVEVSLAGTVVYAGDAVVRSVRQHGERFVVGLSIAQGWLPVGQAVELDDRARLTEELAGELRRLARVVDLPPVLKATVAELRYFLVGLSAKLGEIDGRLGRLPRHTGHRLRHAALEAVSGEVEERLRHFA